TFGTRVRARGAEDELHEVGRLQSRARGHPPKDETPGHLLRRGRCFSRDEDGELVERDGRKHVAAVPHDAEPLHEIHRRRCGTRRDTGRASKANACRFCESAQASSLPRYGTEVVRVVWLWGGDRSVRIMCVSRFMIVRLLLLLRQPHASPRLTCLLFICPYR